MNKNVTIVLSIVLLIIILVGGVSLYRMNKEVSTNNVENTDDTKTPTPVTDPLKLAQTPKTPTATNPFIPTKTEAKITINTGDVVGSVTSSILGEYLTDTKGMTLYVFADDKKLSSSCTGECLKNWPIFTYDNKKITDFKDLLSKRMNVIKRTDGTYQYAYGEKPVYYYIGDKVPGDITGNGMNSGKWSIITIVR
jgi:predicted lipoprotein with Yx(FWY)xxD motif